ncbi:cytochrome P450 [Actinoplanes sp. NPDC049265]|uniref:cytochrome P450 n=1 Tax=Actinoplanes sp. NPDC049265 TaxID=3363902 RepID=UPI0037117449
MTAPTESDLDPLFNPFTTSGQEVMDEVLAAAREHRPVFFSSLLQAWVVTRADDVTRALEDPATFSSVGVLGNPPRKEIAEVLAGRVPEGATLIGWDEPQHRRMKSVLVSAFSRRQVRAMMPGMERRTAALLDGLPAGTPVDALTDIALPLSLDVIFDVIGVPAASRDEFFGWSQDWGRLHGAELEGLDLDHQLRLANSALLLHTAMADLIEARRTDPADDLISAVLAAEAAETVPLPAQELLSLFPGLIFAGHETTAQLIVRALARLLGTPERRELLADDDTLARFVEETARLDSPVGGMARTVTRPARLGGVDLGPGDRVFLHFGSANRDPGAVRDPEDFALDRKVPTAHLAFGRGIHACVGAALGRAEAQVVLRTLVTRWPDARVAGPPELQPHYFIRGFSSLRITR